MLAPNGKDWLTRSGRSPKAVFGEGTEEAMKDMSAIAKRYPVKFDQSKAVVQDFHSIGQALNVASADQRLLVLVAGPKEKVAVTREALKPAINHKDHVGRFHVDFEIDNDEWTKSISESKSDAGILFVKAGEFGSSGKVLRQLPLDASESAIHAALTEANETFIATTEKKEYQARVRKGRRLGIKYESVVPYGEDRDGDGGIDQRARRQRR